MSQQNIDIVGETVSFCKELGEECYEDKQPKIYIPSSVEPEHIKAAKCFAKSVRLRERREFERQYKHLDKDLAALFKIRTSIIEYLVKDKNTRGSPTPDMIAYAKHNWPYNELSVKDRYILCRIRGIVEVHLHKSSLKHVRTRKRHAVCAVCRGKIVEYGRQSAITNCGCVLHIDCIAPLFWDENPNLHRETTHCTEKLQSARRITFQYSH